MFCYEFFFTEVFEFLVVFAVLTVYLKKRKEMNIISFMFGRRFQMSIAIQRHMIRVIMVET